MFDPQLLARPAHCRGCGYDLGGIADEGDCPECGTPAARSRRSFLLADADPSWLAVVDRGWLLLRAAAVIARWTIYGVGAGSLAITSVQWMRNAPSIPLSLGAFFGLGVALAAAVGSIGAAIASAPDPRDATREPAWSARRILRGSLAAAWALAALAATAWFAPIGPIGLSLLFPLAWLGAAGFAVATLSLLRWAAALLARVPAPQLAARARQLERLGRWFLPLALAAILLLRFMPFLFAGPLRGGVIVLFIVPCSFAAAIGFGWLGSTLTRGGRSIRDLHRDVTET